MAAATFALFAVCLWHTSAERIVSREQDRSPPIVYLVPGETPKDSKAILTRELHERLQTLLRPPDSAGAVLLSVVYDGKVVDGTARFKATFQAQCLTDGPTTLLLPLDGVQYLGDAELDGKPAPDFALAPNGGGFAVKVTDRGPHKIELSFSVRLTGGTVSGERGVRFTVPRLSESRLSFQAPAGSSAPQALFRYGNQEVAAEPDGPVLRAELGRIAHRSAGME